MGALEPIMVGLPWDDRLYEASLWEGRIVFDEETAWEIAEHWRAHPDLFPDLYTEFDGRVFQQYDGNGAVIERYTPITDIDDGRNYFAIGCVSDWEWELYDTAPYGPLEPEWAGFTLEVPGYDLDDR